MSQRGVLNHLLVLVAFCCAMRLWQYHIGIRIAIYHVWMVAFTLAYAFRLAIKLKAPRPLAPLRPPIFWLWVIIVLSGSSIFAADLSLPGALEQYLKGILDLLFLAGGLTALALFLTESPAAVSQRLLRAYVLGAAASSIYSFFEVAGAYFGYDLGKAVWGRISVYGPEFDWTAPFYYEWDVFFRAVGFAGVNSQATYTASVIPLLVLARPFRRYRLNSILAAICFVGTGLTFSRNGFFSLFVAFTVYAVIRPTWLIRYLPRIAAICVPGILVALVFSEGARAMISTRLYRSFDGFGAGRFEVYGPTWTTIRQNPLGHGLNQYSIVIAHTDEIDLRRISSLFYMWDDQRIRSAYANVHSDWLNWLFDGGWPLLLARIGYYAALLRACWRTHSSLGYAAVCSMAALLMSGFFNMTLDQFSTELFFMLVTTVAVRLSAGSNQQEQSVRNPCAFAPAKC